MQWLLAGDLIAQYVYITDQNDLPMGIDINMEIEPEREEGIREPSGQRLDRSCGNSFEVDSICSRKKLEKCGRCAVLDLRLHRAMCLAF